MTRQACLALVLIVSIGMAGNLTAADKQYCPIPAEECARQIREILSGGKYLGLKLEQTRRGLIITRVVADSGAERAGLRVGDRIISVNGRDCTSATIKSFKEIMRKIGDARRISFTVDRGGYFKTIDARLEVLTSAQIERIVATHLLTAHADAPKGDGQKEGQKR